MSARSRAGAGPDGVLVIDKPSGPTSHDVVAIARRVLGTPRVGHTGTLDPMATGVLPLVIGRATRLAQYLTAGRKEYVATIGFGRSTDTYDALGTVVATSPERPTRVRLDAALEAFRGTLLQVPPAFSAKKIDGERAYALARSGGPSAVRPAAASVTVHALDVVAFDGDAVTVRLAVAAGFYVRTLAHDLGLALGTGAVLEALRRTRAGSFGLDAALPLADLLALDRASATAHLVPFDRLLPELPSVALGDTGVARIRQGQEVGPADIASSPATTDGLVRLMDETGRLVGMGQAGAKPGFLRAPVVFGLT